MADLEQREASDTTVEDHQRTLVVGLLVDPDTPAEIAAKLVDDLPETLGAQVDSNIVWDLRTMTHPVTPAVHDAEELLDAVADRTADSGWDLGVYLTGLPIQHDDLPILVDLDHDRRVAGLSLPGFGPFLQHRKVRNAVVRLVADLTGTADAGLDWGRHHPSRLGRATARHLQPVLVVHTGDGRHTRRYVTTRWRGRARLLAGMVHTNQPWRLVLGTRTALAAVLGTGAYLTITTSTVWLLSTRLGVGKLVLTSVVSVALMVAWIIGAHHLWERARDEGEQEETVLYNFSTVLTLGIGVLTMSVAVFVLTLLGSLFLLEPSVLGSNLGRPPELADHLQLVWLATSLATVAGALGSGLDSEDAVRRAAYGYRERQRRDEIGQDEETGESPVSSS
ncbi:hypothetical protein EV383_2614 [Pseudonocardia sediminis]|uniref:5,10-methylene-tetrahydrofolate dehydrogenase/Methenyl tetrahydrofolate cyclohydrolase n=1 Tax=Pseudonocardia sediminis TaxID=1397368 RepID=A0A4Q7UXB7_PSEST|nr:hypothetical protein [Pseudonocardia sediminis]RZT85734.1 hypothetical protein EV383_2614 [Pseudonocardia sediminis]